LTAEALLNEVTAFRPVRAAGRPVFRWDNAEYALFYTPGYVCVVGLPHAERFEKTIVSPNACEDSGKWARELRHQAELALARARLWQEAPFSPECLTLYMNNECNLGCVYCYADPARTPIRSVTSLQRGDAAKLGRGRTPASRLDMDAIAAAAGLVARNCQQKGRPFYVVFHGGGEPTLHRERVEGALLQLQRVAAAHGVELFRYVATNGVMPEKKAVWLARHFDLVGLSCDGPPDIQDAQRPLWDGGPTGHRVEQTARILRAEGQTVHVRVTVTRGVIHRQAEIVEYVCEKLFPEELYLEPMYVGGRATIASGLGSPEVMDFCEHFLEARRTAQRYGVPLVYAGSRLDQVHGPHCNVFRQVLNVVPGGVATACFKETDASRARAKGMDIGALDEQIGRFTIDYAKVRDLRQRLNTSPAHCHDCFNRFHCAGACPDTCTLGDQSLSKGGAAGASFRCQAQKAVTAVTLQEVAEAVWSQSLCQGKNGKVYGKAVV
jgi:uncharacterized protein